MKLTVLIPARLHTAAKVTAAQRHTTMTALVVSALARDLGGAVLDCSNPTRYKPRAGGAK